jgi:predicted Ser/Thr protein kinase
MNIFDHYRQRYEAAKDEEFTLQEFLTICRQDRSAYANAAERLLMAIGEPVMVDTASSRGYPVSFQTGLSHAIRRLKSFTVWKMPLSRSFPTQACRPGAGREETDPLSAGPGGRR